MSWCFQRVAGLLTAGWRASGWAGGRAGKRTDLRGAGRRACRCAGGAYVRRAGCPAGSVSPGFDGECTRSYK